MNDWTPERAFTGGLTGLGQENWFSGATSLFRRRYAAEPAGADVAVLGVPFDQAVTNRPGARFGPRAIRQASTMISWPGGPWRWSADPFAHLAVVDTGDLFHDTGDPMGLAAALEARAAAIIASGAKILALGGDHFTTWPILKAYAARHGPIALVQFDSHSDTWRDEGNRIDHGTMFFRAVEEGTVDAAPSVRGRHPLRQPGDPRLQILDADTVGGPWARKGGVAHPRGGGRGAATIVSHRHSRPRLCAGHGTPV